QAITSVVRKGLFKRRRSGRFWHRVPFGDLAELRRYLWEHLRFVHRAEWVVDVATRKRHSNDRFVIRRAVRYELLEARLASSPRDRARPRNRVVRAARSAASRGAGTRIINGK